MCLELFLINIHGHLPTLKRNMDVIRHIRENYVEILPAYRHYERRLVTCKRTSNQINFLKQCIEEQVVPRSFGHIADPAFSGEPFPAYAKYFLEDRVQRASAEKEILLYSLRRTRSELRASLPDVVFEGAMIRAGEVALRNIVAHRLNLDNKIDNLCKNSVWERYYCPDKVVTLNDVQLDQNQKILLSFGLNFSIGATNFDFLQSLSDINRFNYSQNNSSIH